MRSLELGGETADLGAEFVGPAHRRIRTVASRASIPLEPARVAGAPVIWTAGGVQRTARFPRLRPTELAGVARAAIAARRLARGIDPDAPWLSESAAELDSRSVAEWLSNIGVAGRALTFARALLEGFATVPVERLSLLHLLWWTRRGGLLGAARWRVGGGAQRLAGALAASLREPILLDTDVEAIEQSRSEVSIHARGREHRARRAIVAVPLPALTRIRFEPQLPELARAASMMPFGQATSLLTVTSERRRCGAPSAALGGGELGLAWRRGQAIKTLALRGREGEAEASLVREFGVPEGDRVERSVEWSQDPLVGHTSPRRPAGSPATAGVFGSHTNRVHFAAAERSSWPDSMEGALESGERTPTEVLMRLD